MTVKLFEILDRQTCIPAVGMECSPDVRDLPWTFDRERALLRRVGYGGNRVILFGKLTGGDFVYDPHTHMTGARTMTTAHQYITANWDRLKSGDVIDVEFILGESEAQRTTDLP